MSIDLHSSEPQAAPAHVELPRRQSTVATHSDILHLAELVPVVRKRFALADTFADDAILASLRVIASQTLPRDRWRAAFASNLGVALVREGCDLNTALNTLIALLPRPTS